MTVAASQVPSVAEWRDRLARVGLVAKGALYVVLGSLAVEFARGEASGDEVSQTGAIERMAEQPFGKFLLLALTAGLLCLTLVHVIQALTGDPVEGDEARDRLGYALKAVVYGALTLTAARITVDNWSGRGTSSGSSSGSGDEQAREAASTLFDLPGGRLLVVAVGLALLGIAVYQVVVYVVRAEHMDRLRGAGETLRTFGRIGYSARAVVFAVCGVFFLVAAARHDPGEAKGISGALQELAQHTWGRVVLWLVAVGLVVFGVFCLAEARLRRR